MKKCKLCGSTTTCVVNIKLKAVPVCDDCTWAVTVQTVTLEIKEREERFENNTYGMRRS